MTDTEPSSDTPEPPELARGGRATSVATAVSSRGIETPPHDEGVRLPGLRLAALIGALVLLGFVNPWMLVVILALVLMITLHELGHYLTAKRAGMKVTEFFLGFGPKIWSTRRGETEYGIKAIPAGAYVKIIGMHNLEEVPPEDEVRTYRQKSFGQRVSVAVAGSTMHFLLALGLIFVSLAFVGLPAGTLDPDTQAREWRVSEVIEGSGAAEAGLRAGDDVIAVDGRDTPTSDDLRDVVDGREGDTVPVTFVRNGETRTVDVTLQEFESDGQQGCCLGVGIGLPDDEKLSPLSAAVNTPREFVNITGLSVQAMGRFFTPGGISDFAGQVSSARDDRAAPTGDDTGGSGSSQSSSSSPSSSSSGDDDEVSENRMLSIYGLVQIGSEAGKVDPSSLITLFALVNIFIGVFNLVPLLPFDGGHVAIAVYEKVQERRLGRRRYFTDVARLLPLTYAVVLVLGMLFVSTLYLDIANPLVSQ